MVDLSKVPIVKYAKQEEVLHLLAAVSPMRGVVITQTFVMREGEQWCTTMTFGFPVPTGASQCLRATLNPATDHVIIKEGLQELVVDGISMPDNVKQREMLMGMVIFTGPEVSRATHVNDIVLYGPWAGKNIIIDGIEFRLLREGQIEAYIRKSN